MSATNRTIMQEVHQKIKHLTGFKTEELQWEENTSFRNHTILTCRVRSNGASMTISIQHKKGGVRVSVIKFFEPKLLKGNRFSGLVQKFSDWVSERNGSSWKGNNGGKQNGAEKQIVG